jgi:hypothetical protein
MMLVGACDRSTPGNLSAKPSTSTAASAARVVPSPIALAAQLRCRLPVVTWGSFDPRAVPPNSGAGGQGSDLGFYQFPSGPAVIDSTDLIGFDPRSNLYHTLREPVLWSEGGQPSWDLAAGRWVPVDAALVSPDGSRYAWTQYPRPDSPYSQIHVTEVATGVDQMVLQSGPADQPGYSVVRFDSTALLLTRLGASEVGFYNSNRGLWRLNLATRNLTALQDVAFTWLLLSPGAAWSNDLDPQARAVPAPTPDVGVMPNEIRRYDLVSGAMETWLSRSNRIVTLIGVDAMDHPLIRIQSETQVEISYSTAPSAGTLIYRSNAPPVYGPADNFNATGAGYRPEQVMVDGHGIWLVPHYPYVAVMEPDTVRFALFTPGLGLQNMPTLGKSDSLHDWHPAGPCIE